MCKALQNIFLDGLLSESIEFYDTDEYKNLLFKESLRYHHS